MRFRRTGVPDREQVLRSPDLGQWQGGEMGDGGPPQGNHDGRDAPPCGFDHLPDQGGREAGAGNEGECPYGGRTSLRLARETCRITL